MGLRAARLARIGILAVSWLAGAPSHAAVSGVGRVMHVSIPSPALHDDTRSVRVYLPPSYDRPDSARQRYPLVILLHGWPGGDGNWLGQGHASATLDSLIASRAIPAVIALMPNGNGPGLMGHSRYIDAWDGSFSMQQFIVRDLVHWADSTLRTIPEPSRRALIGLSDGGDAAINLALRYPQVFGGAGGLSGFYRPQRELGDGRVFGPEPNATRLLLENSPWNYLPRVAGSARFQTLFFATGTSDEMLADNRAFHARLDSLDIPHVYREYPGSHSWGFWRVHLRDALLAVAGRMRGGQ